jgi:hypothetical protein
LVGKTNSINVGGVFGTGIYSATTGNPSVSVKQLVEIGVTLLNPAVLHIGPSTTLSALMRLSMVQHRQHQTMVIFGLNQILTLG